MHARCYLFRMQAHHRYRKELLAIRSREARTIDAILATLRDLDPDVALLDLGRPIDSLRHAPAGAPNPDLSRTDRMPLHRRRSPARRGRPGRRVVPRTVALAAAALGLAVSGCGAGGGPTDRAGVLVAAIGADPGHLNPAITTSGGVHAAASLLYDGLVALGEDQSPIPQLAARWEVEEGGAAYRFHLRTDVRWHDGRPFTAADVKYTFEEVLLRFHARTRASLEPVLAGIDAPDDSTVVFRFHRPYAPLLQQLDVVEAPILPRHVFAGSDPERNPANHAPIGTGPFRFVSHRPEVELRYARNDDYFAGAPDLATVILRVIPDEATQVIALEAGEVDWLFGVPGPARERLRRNGDVAFLETTINPGGSHCITTMALNLDRPALADVRVRRALAHALDRVMFVDRVAFGEGRVATAPMSSRLPVAASGDVALPAHDTATAGRLLDEAGWRRGPNGVRVARGVDGVADGTRLVIGFKQFPSFARHGELVRAQLRPVGIEVRLETLEPAVFVQSVFARRDFDTAIVSYCNGTDPQIGVRRQYASSSIGPVPFSNAAGYRNPEVDELFEAAVSALDPDARRSYYQRIQEIAVRDLPYIWLVESAATRAHRRRCTGFGEAAHFAATARCGP
jgi:peptide/nickel transport system substrate-binding protein